MLKKIAILLGVTLTFSSYNLVLAVGSKSDYKKQQILKSASLQAKRIETSLVVDSKSGKVLHAKNPHARIFPASLTKLMTLYLTFEALEKEKLKMDQKLYASKAAEKAPPSKLHIKAGDNITVKEAILSQITKSANDISIVLAEAIAGSEDKFARLMTFRARQLGMKNTTFKNASGLHHPDQKSTALDLAKLTIALKRDYIKYYPLFSQTSFVFKGKIINGHNPIVANYEGAEGLKTGYTNSAGHNLITTASRKGKSLIGVVTGTSSKHHRDKKMVNLLDTHFGVVLASQRAPLKRNYNIKKKIVKI